MAQIYGLGNFLYEIEVTDGKANFKFWDQEDASNTAEVSVAKADFPEGIVDADSRQVAEIAFDQCQRVLNEKRDARHKKEAADSLADKTKEEARVRQVSQDYLNSTEDTVVKPHHVERDGTKVYNTETPSDDDNKKK